MRRERWDGVVNRINAVGIEMEGGWADSPNWEIVHDGSVKFDPSLSPRPYYIGEVVSEPTRSLEELESWMTSYYPKFVNDTCGLHTHMSFRQQRHYALLMTPEYTDYMVEFLKQWAREIELPANHMFWSRMDPNHPWTRRHCLHRYLGDAQVLQDHKDYRSRGTKRSRYTFVNYCYRLYNRRTLEVRGLPMFDDPLMAVAAVRMVLKATNLWLSKHHKRDTPVEASIKPGKAVYKQIGSFLDIDAEDACV